jgi:hypothetical protein
MNNKVILKVVMCLIYYLPNTFHSVYLPYCKNKNRPIFKILAGESVSADLKKGESAHHYLKNTSKLENISHLF